MKIARHEVATQCRENVGGLTTKVPAGRLNCGGGGGRMTRRRTTTAHKCGTGRRAKATVLEGSSCVAAAETRNFILTAPRDVVSSADTNGSRTINIWDCMGMKINSAITPATERGGTTAQASQHDRGCRKFIDSPNGRMRIVGYNQGMKKSRGCLRMHPAATWMLRGRNPPQSRSPGSASRPRRKPVCRGCSKAACEQRCGEITAAGVGICVVGCALGCFGAGPGYLGCFWGCVNGCTTLAGIVGAACVGSCQLCPLR